MKLTLGALSPLFFLLSSSSEPTTAQSNPPHSPVLDITHSPVKTNIKYYILPVIQGRGVGVNRFNRDLPLCRHPGSLRGLLGTPCKESTAVWRVEGYDEKTRQWYVTTGGVEGNLGCQTVINWFTIEKFGDDNKLVFCPNV